MTRIGKRSQPLRVLFAQAQRVEQDVEIALDFVDWSQMAERAGQQFAHEEDFVGKTGFGNYANVRVVRPEFVEDVANFLAAGMGIDLGGELKQAVGSPGRGDVEEIAESVVDPDRSLARGAGVERQEFVESSCFLGSGWSVGEDIVD